MVGVQGRAQRPATADASLLGAGQPSGFAGPKPVWRQSSVAAAVERRLRPVSSSGEDEAEVDAAACFGAAEGGPEQGPPAGAGGHDRDGAAGLKPCSSGGAVERRGVNRNKGSEEGFGYAPSPSAGSITAGGCAPTRRSARPRPRIAIEVGTSTGCHMPTLTAACHGMEPFMWGTLAKAFQAPAASHEIVRVEWSVQMKQGGHQLQLLALSLYVGVSTFSRICETNVTSTLRE